MNDTSAPINHVPCLGAQVVRDYLDDRLGPDEEARVERHLTSCAACQNAIQTAGGNADWWQAVRNDMIDERASDSQESGPCGTADGILDMLAPTDDPAMLGRLGHYEVQGVIGQGSTGVVLRAIDPRLNRVVAIKVLAPSSGINGVARQRFQREARAVAAVAHDHVVPIYGVDEHRGLHYIVMKYVPGASLHARIQRDGPLTTQEATRVGYQIARALDAAHGLGIVHRDVKPANVLVEGSVDRVVVTDFGLASVADEAPMTFSGAIHGTPSYMSPEQARGEPVDARSDLFSLGSLLYEACTGRPPFRAQTLFGIIRRVCETEPQPIRSVNPEIDEWLEAFIGRLMAKSVNARFQSADEVARAFGAELAYLQSPSSVARPDRWWWPRSRAPRRRTGWAVAVACIGLGGIGAAVLGMMMRGALQPGADPSLDAASAIVAAPESGEPSQQTWTVRRSVPADAGGEVTVRVDRGAVTIIPADTDEVVLEFTGAISPEDGTAPEHELTLDPTETGAAIAGTLGQQHDWLRASYTITVPSRSDVVISTSAGDIVVGDLDGGVDVRVEGGDITLGRIGGNVDAWANLGSISMLEGCAGEARLVAIQGMAAMARVSGDAYAITSGGDVWIGESTGSVGAQTSGGNVYIDGVAGSVRAHATGGDVLLWAPLDPAADVRVNAANGAVVLLVADDLNATIETIGDLATDIAFAPDAVVDDAGASWASAKLNAGGPVVRASTASGPVEVRVVDADAPMTLADALRRAGHRSTMPQHLVDQTSQTAQTIAAIRAGGEPVSPIGTSADGSSSLPSRSGDVSRSGLAVTSGPLSRSSLGGSSLGGSGSSSISSSGLGGSGGGSPTANGSGATVENAAPRPGELTTVRLTSPAGNMDGYTIYLPVSHERSGGPYPILVYLQGAFGVGDRIEAVNDWGLARLLRDETDTSTPRNRLLLDTFIVLNLHIRTGGYDDSPATVRAILDQVIAEHNGDPSRLYVTGLSRGGHGTWGLAEALPGTFAAIAPIGGSSEGVEDWSRLGDTAVWISHNAADSRVSFVNAERAMTRLRTVVGAEFRHFDRLIVRGTDFLDHRYILTSAPTTSHDAWTEVYSHAEFYVWLLAQQRR